MFTLHYVDSRHALFTGLPGALPATTTLPVRFPSAAAAGRAATLFGLAASDPWYVLAPGSEAVEQVSAGWRAHVAGAADLPGTPAWREHHALALVDAFVAEPFSFVSGGATYRVDFACQLSRRDHHPGAVVTACIAGAGQRTTVELSAFITAAGARQQRDFAYLHTELDQLYRAGQHRTSLLAELAARAGGTVVQLKQLASPAPLTELPLASRPYLAALGQQLALQLGLPSAPPYSDYLLFFSTGSGPHPTAPAGHLPGCSGTHLLTAALGKLNSLLVPTCRVPVTPASLAPLAAGRCDCGVLHDLAERTAALLATAPVTLPEVTPDRVLVYASGAPPACHPPLLNSSLPCLAGADPAGYAELFDLARLPYWQLTERSPVPVRFTESAALQDWARQAATLTGGWHAQLAALRELAGAPAIFPCGPAAVPYLELTATPRLTLYGGLGFTFCLDFHPGTGPATNLSCSDAPREYELNCHPLLVAACPAPALALLVERVLAACRELRQQADQVLQAHPLLSLWLLPSNPRYPELAAALASRLRAMVTACYPDPDFAPAPGARHAAWCTGARALTEFALAALEQETLAAARHSGDYAGVVAAGLHGSGRLGCDCQAARLDRPTP